LAFLSPLKILIVKNCLFNFSYSVFLSIDLKGKGSANGNLITFCVEFFFKSVESRIYGSIFPV